MRNGFLLGDPNVPTEKDEAIKAENASMCQTPWIDFHVQIVQMQITHHQHFDLMLYKMLKFLHYTPRDKLFVISSKFADTNTGEKTNKHQKREAKINQGTVFTKVLRLYCEAGVCGILLSV